MANSLSNEEVKDLVLKGISTGDIRSKGVYAHTVKRVRARMKAERVGISKYSKGTLKYRLEGNKIVLNK